jgi:sugar/nucleoside kinase (ribokinase family)
MEEKVDFLAIGDVTVDAFIRLENANVNCEIDHQRCELCVDFGAKIPYESVEEIFAVGNSANAAVAAARLGLNAALIATVGNDENGAKCLASLKKNGVRTNLISVQNGAKTNYHYVLWYEEERTILVKHEPYYRQLPVLPPTSLIYLSSLGPETISYHEEIKKFLEKNPRVRLIFQPGTFQISESREGGLLYDFYRRAEVVAVNLEEARKITNLPAGEPAELLNILKSRGTKIVLITNGVAGAYLIDESGRWFMPPFPDPKPPLERTGAGDAFTATFAAALALGQSNLEAFAWGLVNAMSVVQQIGAQAGLLTRTELEKILARRPPGFEPEKI